MFARGSLLAPRSSSQGRPCLGGAALLVLSLALLGCGQSDPEPVDEESRELVPPDPGEYDSRYPLVDGATWVYAKTTAGGQVLGREEIEAFHVSHEGEDAIMIVDSPNADGEWTESVLMRQGSTILRVAKTRQNALGPYSLVDYDPGFIRIDDGWEAVGELGDLTYTRTETDPGGLNPDVEERGHEWTVNALDEVVSVPAGTFDCISVTRVRTTGATAGETVHFWFAPGVGKVREQRPESGEIEELLEFDIPGGLSGP